MPLIVLPLISSAFTPIDAMLAVAWSIGLAALGYRWSTSKFNHDPK